MFSKINTYGIHGVESYRIAAEVDVSDGLPGFSMVGYLAEETREAQERVRTALRNAGFSIPPRRVTVNLSPAGIRKSGTSFDCAVALGILCCIGKLDCGKLAPFAFLGELGLDGRIRPVNGVLPSVLAAGDDGLRAVFVPSANVLEGSLAEGIPVIGAESLTELVEILRHRDPTEFASTAPVFGKEKEEPLPDFADIQGLPLVRLASMAACAGGHNILYIGPAGTGKTMTASRLPSLMPPMSRRECLEVSKLYSICGLLDPKFPLVTRRPFRAPHHSITPASLIGGGRRPVPGEISLASGGILFLDELPEFAPRIIDLLRQPLEEKEVRVNRLSGSERYPADFILAAAMNPCKCGYYPDMAKCRCTEAQRQKYLSSVSGPFLDRIDIGVEVPLQRYHLHKIKNAEDSSSAMRKKVLAAARIQEDRFSGTGIRKNADMTPDMLREYCPMEQEAASFLERYLSLKNVSARGADKILKISRTLADLEARERISANDLAQAVSFRSFAEHYWRRG
ncbi:MAG: YifB family Mg chelatase-like AAA ATPase [Clostridium sp.]|nr:YifB family Mg chelatase-like AAA ATPase [Clostridium sp.]